MNEKPSSIKITIQLFIIAMLMSLILDLVGMSVVGILFWITVPPVIVGQYYIKKYKVVMPENLRKYSAIYYMFLSCLIGFIVVIFTLQTENKIGDLTLVAAILLFFIFYFIVGVLSVYSALGEKSKKN